MHWISVMPAEAGTNREKLFCTPAEVYPERNPGGRGDEQEGFLHALRVCYSTELAPLTGDWASFLFLPTFAFRERLWSNPFLF